MKICNKCLCEKDIIDFPKTGRVCKSCKSEYRKKYKEENRDKIKEASNIYYEKNKDKILEYSKSFYEENKEKYKKYRELNKDRISNNHKRYVENNNEKIKEYGKKYRKDNNEYLSEYRSLYYQNNKEDITIKNKLYYEENKEKISEKRKEYNKIYRENNKEEIRIRNINWKLDNPNYYQEYYKNRCEVDKLFYLSIRIRSLIRVSLYNKGLKKNSKTQEILGCSFDEFKLHLESMFEPWMNWDNHGLYNGELNYGWDIDHIIPLSSAKTEEDIIELNHYKNLKPLCSYLNRVVKRDFY